MTSAASLFRTSALAAALAAFGAALFIYQRHNIKLHRTYAKKLLDAHEEERAWVAREVHDDALQRVAMLQHELNEWDSGEFSTTDGPRATSLRIEALRETCEMNLSGLKMLTQLLDEVEQLRQELRARR